MSEILQLTVDRAKTPIGEMMILADHDGNLRAVDWTDHEVRMLRLLGLHYGKNGFKLEPRKDTNGFVHAIDQYFAGQLSVLDTFPVKTAGTPFQRIVWRALRTIPAGTTITYAKLAEQIASPKAVRAVGLANGSNPVGVIVPCHRVIGTNGSLTGYGGGVDRKRWLLDHEAAPSTFATSIRVP